VSHKVIGRTPRENIARKYEAWRTEGEAYELSSLYMSSERYCTESWIAVRVKALCNPEIFPLV